MFFFGILVKEFDQEVFREPDRGWLVKDITRTLNLDKAGCVMGSDGNCCYNSCG